MSSSAATGVHASTRRGSNASDAQSAMSATSGRSSRQRPTQGTGTFKSKKKAPYSVTSTHRQLRKTASVSSSVEISNDYASFRSAVEALYKSCGKVSVPIEATSKASKSRPLTDENWSKMAAFAFEHLEADGSLHNAHVRAQQLTRSTGNDTLTLSIRPTYARDEEKRPFVRHDLCLGDRAGKPSVYVSTRMAPSTTSFLSEDEEKSFRARQLRYNKKRGVSSGGPSMALTGSDASTETGLKGSIISAGEASQDTASSMS